MKEKFNWDRKRMVGLGPMDGVTDSPFRYLNRQFGADFTFTEMISADGLVHKSKTIFEKLKFRKGERPIIAQIFGKDPEIMGEAAEMLEKEFKFDGIDINCACPSKNVLKSGHGGALLKDEELLLSLLDVVRHKTTLPLSVKTRLGFNDSQQIIKLAPKMEKKGINAIIVHSRTVLQKFQNLTDKSAYLRLKQQISVPIIATGDVFNQTDIAELFEKFKVDGVLVARGALGNPWIFEGLEIVKNNPKQFLEKSKSKKLIQEISSNQRKETVLEHLNLMIATYGDELACVLFRKHLLWYLGRVKGTKKLKTKATLIQNRQDVEKILEQL